MLNCLFVGLGGMAGTVARFWLNGIISQRFVTFPMGTLIINISGSFIIGFFSTLTGTEGRWMVTPALRETFMIGVCGGFTTFSSFSLQTLTLMEDREWAYAGANAVGSLALWLVAVWLGHVLAQKVNLMKGI